MTLPELLRLTDPGLRETLDALPASVALIGIGTDGQPASADLDNESLHVLGCSAGGGGTTTILRTLTHRPAPTLRCPPDPIGVLLGVIIRGVEAVQAIHLCWPDRRKRCWFRWIEHLNREYDLDTVKWGAAS